MMNENNNNENNNNISNEEQLAALKKKKGPIVVLINVVSLFLIAAVVIWLIDFYSKNLGEDPNTAFLVPGLSPILYFGLLIVVLCLGIGYVIAVLYIRKRLINNALIVRRKEETSDNKNALIVQRKEETSDNKNGGYKMTAKDILIFVIVLFICSIIMAFVHK